MLYRDMDISEVDQIRSIDATCYIKYAWRSVSGKMQLVEIDWTDHELPNGLQWHMDRFCKTIQTGGKAFGCFKKELLIGYATVNAEIFGKHAKYVLLDQIFISKDYREQGIGKYLFALCKQQAVHMGADKLYICAGSAENTIAFYRKLGCVSAEEINQDLYDEDPNDLQLEISLHQFY